MNTPTWLAYAFALVWIGLGGYITLLLLRLGQLEKRMHQLETLNRKQP